MTFLRRHRLDAALVALAAVVLATSIGHGSTTHQSSGALAAAALLVLLARHWQPLISTVVVFVAIMLGTQLEPSASSLIFFVVLAVFGVVGTLDRRRDAVTGWLVGSVTFGAGMSRNPYVSGAGDITFTLAFCTLIWGAGLLVSERSRAASLAHARADEMQVAREIDLRDAVAQERSRIAAELHDIVSHGLSVVVLQAVAGRMALQDNEPHPVIDRRLDAVESTARDALADMRRMFGLIQQDPDGTCSSAVPAVSLAQLPTLVAQLRDAGAAITLNVESGIELPAGLDAAVYRIVQEALTNVVKHAPGAPAAVTVTRGADELRVVIHNEAVPGRPSGLNGSGRGLIGMRERVALYGGTLSIEQDTGFRVAVTFPPAQETRPTARPRRRVRPS